MSYDVTPDEAGGRRPDFAPVGGNGLAMQTPYGREQAQRLLYNELIEFALDGYLVTDLSGVICELNFTAAHLLNSRKEFLLGKPLAFFVGRDQRSAFYNEMVQVTQRGTAIGGLELRVCPVNRVPFHASLSSMVVSDDNGLPAGLRWILRDVSARKQTEQALKAERNFADVLVNTAPTAILVVDTNNRVHRANPFAAALCGWEPGELVGADWRTALVAEQERPRADAMVKSLAAAVWAAEVFAVGARDGRHRTVAWTGKRLTQSAEQTTIMLTGQDVTALHQAQQKAVQTERLAAIGQTMTGMAHEGRNALQRSHSCLALLAWKLKGQPEELDLVTRVQKALDDLLHLLEDVQGYAAPIHLERGRCDLAEVWREAWENLAPARAGRDVELAEDTAGVDFHCYADHFRLRQVFRNILDNALSACKDPVRIRIACRDGSLLDQPALRVSVGDNGPGLGPEQQARIFEAFYTTKVKGTGLGMAIAKRVVEAHGGRISVGNPVGGAEIVITLPRNRP
jgi:PAS domain S-box-containing protein